MATRACERDQRGTVVGLRASKTLLVGEEVYAIGAPRGLELSLSDGLVSSVRKSDAGSPVPTGFGSWFSPGDL